MKNIRPMQEKILEIRLKNPRRIYEKYTQIFQPCFGKLLGAQEICKMAKFGTTPTISLFKNRYLPTLYRLGLVIELPVNDLPPITKKFLERIHKRKSSDRRIKNYYYFLPITSKMMLTFQEILPRFRELFIDRGLIESEAKKLMLKYRAFELHGFRGEPGDEMYSFEEKELDRFIELINKNIDLKRVLKPALRKNQDDKCPIGPSKI